MEDFWSELIMLSDSRRIPLGSPYVIFKGPPGGVRTASQRKARITILSDEKGINNELQEDSSCPSKKLQTKGLCSPGSGVSRCP